MVSEAVKRAVLSQSVALVYPSKWEGFGIPPLEAMAVGTPVIAADIPPLREVCADLAEFCDPYDIDDIAGAIVRVTRKSPAERADYAGRARQHARGYSWAAAASKLRTTLAALDVPETVRPSVVPAGYAAN
jgi:glycosyltransferase involved in cell wall biosynthesis